MPYSFLASLRADRLVESGVATVAWRAVVHDPSVPPEGRLVHGQLAEMFDRELEEIRGLVAPGEAYPARRPPISPNTDEAVAGYGVLRGEDADRLRADLFWALWVQGDDIGTRAVLDRLGCPDVRSGETTQPWQLEWQSMERASVPMMVLPSGRVSRGLGVLARLAELAGQPRGERVHGN